MPKPAIDVVEGRRTRPLLARGEVPDDALVAQALADALGAADPASLHLEAVAASAKLSKRFVTYVVDAPHGGRLEVVGKRYDKRDRGELAFRLLRALELALGSSRFRVVHPLAWLPEYGFQLMEKASGQTLHALLVRDPDDVEPVRLAIGWLIALHAVAAPPFVPRRRARAEQSLDRVVAELRTVLDGALHPRLEALDAELRESARDPGDAGVPDVLLHGDFHPLNVFVNGDDDAARVTAIDVDHAAVGDRAWDIGYLMGQMRASSLQIWHDADRLAAAAAIALDTYSASLPPDDRAPMRRRARRFEALTLLESLHYSRCILRLPDAALDGPFLEGAERAMRELG